MSGRNAASLHPGRTQRGKECPAKVWAQEGEGFRLHIKVHVIGMLPFKITVVCVYDVCGDACTVAHVEVRG